MGGGGAIPHEVMHRPGRCCCRLNWAPPLPDAYVKILTLSTLQWDLTGRRVFVEGSDMAKSGWRLSSNPGTSYSQAVWPWGSHVNSTFPFTKPQALGVVNEVLQATIQAQSRCLRSRGRGSRDRIERSLMRTYKQAQRLIYPINQQLAGEGQQDSKSILS